MRIPIVLLIIAAGCDKGRSDAAAINAAPIFELELWPGEGIPIIQTVGSRLTLVDSPRTDARVVDTLLTAIGKTISYDSTRFQTIASTPVHVLTKARIEGRYLGPVRYLSRQQYYFARFPDTAVTVNPPVVIQYLQPRAEGACFVQLGDNVLEARTCPTLDAKAFRVEGSPKTLWWIHLNEATARGWLLLTDSTARVVRRRF